MKRINLLQPTYDWRTLWNLIKVMRSGWVMFGAKTKEFEEEFAKYVGAKYAIATNSCTSALDICLKVYGIKGGELITTPMTFVSDAIVGEWNGMDVTFADINPRTLCIDPKAIKVTKDTKAIIAVDCHGRLADIDGIREVCGNYKPLIIEDAAHAMFTPGAGKGDITVWSFQAVKTMPIFDGGMITTNNKEVYDKLRALTWLGVEKLTYDRVGEKSYTWKYDITQADAIKGYMTDVQAIIGLGQLRRLEKTNKKRREIQERYNKAFSNVKQIKLPEYSHTVQYYTPEFENRDVLSEFLGRYGIHTSVHFMPLNTTTYWKKAEKTPLTNNNKVWKKLLSLPVHNALTKRQQRYIIKKVKEFYEIHNK